MCVFNPVLLGKSWSIKKCFREATFSPVTVEVKVDLQELINNLKESAIDHLIYCVKQFRRIIFKITDSIKISI